MFQTMRNAWRIEDLRKKILFTLLIILLYRLGNAVPVPYVNVASLNNYFTSMQNTVLGLLNVMSGGAFSNATTESRITMPRKIQPSFSSEKFFFLGEVPG